MKILNDEIVLAELDPKDAKIFTMGLQIHTEHVCGCIVVNDKLGNWLFPCKAHKPKFDAMRDNELIHKNI